MYDAVERAVAVLTANFDADMAAIVTDRAVAVTAQVATVYKRREWSVFAELSTFSQAAPGIGVYATEATTNAKRQNERDWTVSVVAEYYARGPDPAKLAVQAELAVEAILRSVDRMNEGLLGSRILDAGGPANSVSVECSRTAHLESGDRYYEELAKVTFPVVDQEVIP